MKTKSGEGSFCSDCKKVRTFQSGPAVKSPPKEKLKKNHFRKRWMVLSLVELCTTCRKNQDGVASSEEKRYCSVLSYYTDQSESTLKGDAAT